MRKSGWGMAAILLWAPAAVWAFDAIQLKQIIPAPASIKKLSPGALALSPRGDLWALDPDNDFLVLFSSSGAWVKTVGGRGILPGQFDRPHALAIGPDGELFVADAGNNRIERFDADGKWLAAFGDKGSGPGQLETPWTLALSQDGVIVVGEKGRGRIQLFSKDGVYLSGFDTGAPVDGLAMDAASRIYVSHAKLRLVEQWSVDGQMLRRLNGEEPGVKPFKRPVDLAVAASGLLYVGDRAAHRFREIDLAGHTSGGFGHAGSGDGEFRRLSGLAVSNAAVFLGDAKLHRISVLTLSAATPLAPLMPVPASRFEIERETVLPAAVSQLAVLGDDSLEAVSAAGDLLLHIDPQGKTLHQTDLKTELAIRAPSGLTVAPTSGHLFIADAAGNRILKCDRDGRRLLEIGKSKHFFKGREGELSAPAGLSCSPKGILYVADTGNARFQAFNHQALFQFAGGGKEAGPGRLRTPVDIAWDHDRIYVVDSGDKKVAVYGDSGRFSQDLTPPVAETWVDPRRVSVDHEGNVFVLDAGRGHIVCFDPQGNFLGAFGRLGKTDGTFDRPHALAMGERGDLFIAEAGRIERFRVAVRPAAPTRLAASPGEGYIALHWDAVKARYPVKYAVYRAAAGAAPERVKETVETSITDDTLLPGTTYDYAVAAESAHGAASAPSEPIAASAQRVKGPRIEIVTADIDDVFSAHYKFYSRTPFGHVRIRNNGESPVEKIKVSFAIQGYMDYPTETTIDELHVGEEKDVPLLATFNNRILEVTETTPIQAQVTCSFYSGDQERRFTRHLPFKLYSRNTIRWDNPERLSAFITPNDPSVIDFARGVVTPFALRHAGAAVPQSVLNAWVLFEGLGAYGMSYAPRPNNPYDRVSLDSTTVDSLQFARETLARKSGDCADVVALLASMLESMTVTTAALEAPGHLFLMFDTGYTDKSALGFPDSLVVSYAGSYWIPIEATLVGSPFMDAWKKGADEYRRYNQQGTLTPVDIHIAWRTFEPATLPEVAGSLKAPERDEIESRFLPDWKILAELRWQTSATRLKEEAAKNPDAWLQLGLLAVEFHRDNDAKTFFLKAAERKSTQAAAYNNLGNLALIQHEAAGAAQWYVKAWDADGKDAQISLNLARAYLKMARAKDAAAAFDRAMRLDASLRESYPDVSSLAP